MARSGRGRRPRNTAPTYAHATHAEQLAAAVIDFVVIVALSTIGYALGSGMAPSASNWSALWVGAAFAIAIVVGGLGPMAVLGWTTGMLVAGIRIVDFDTGRPPGWRKVLRRTLGMLHPMEQRHAAAPQAALEDQLTRVTSGTLSLADVVSGTIVVKKSSLTGRS